MAKPVLMYYSSHESSVSTVAQTVAIANELCHRFDVVLLADTRIPDAIYVDPRIDMSELPPLRGQLSGKPGDWRAATQSDLTRRGGVVLERYSRIKPEVILIDGYPLGDPAAAGALSPMLDRVRFGHAAPPLVAASMSDLYAGRRRQPADAVDIAADVLNDFFDLLLVHTDSGFGRLEEFFQPRNTLSIPVFHTGFVAAPRMTERYERSDAPRMVVCLDGRIEGGRLIRAAVDAYDLLSRAHNVVMTLIVGDSIRDDDWREFSARAADDPGLEIWRQSPNRTAEFCRARWAVTHCDHDALLDVTGSGIAAVFVPTNIDPDSDEFDRAWRLAHCGVGNLATPGYLNSASMASYLHKLIATSEKPQILDLRGAEVTVNVLYRMYLYEDGDTAAPGLSREHDSRSRYHH